MQIVWGMLGGGLVSLVSFGILSLKLFRLQFALGALKDAVLSLRNTSANRARTDKKLEMEQFMQEAQVHKKERFANDPPGWT